MPNKPKPKQSEADMCTAILDALRRANILELYGMAIDALSSSARGYYATLHFEIRSYRDSRENGEFTDLDSLKKYASSKIEDIINEEDFRFSMSDCSYQSNKSVIDVANRILGAIKEATT